MKKTVWYVSKYFEVSTESSPGGRPFLIWKELAKSGYNAVVITSDSNHLVYAPKFEGNMLRQWVEGVQIFWLNTLKINKAKSLKRILSWIHFEINLFFLKKADIPAPDLVVVSSPSLLTILNGFFLRKKYRCKLAFEVRDIWPLTLTEEGGYSKSNIFIRLMAWVEKFSYKYSDYIIGTMPNLAEHVENILGYERKVYCLPMGVSDSSVEAPDDLVDEEYFSRYFPLEKFLVVYAGTIGITNALDIFFECAHRMRNVEDIHFVLVGDGALKKIYKEKYSGFKNISFAAQVEKNQVQSVLRRADVVYFSTFPSEIWRYGQSLNKLIDYMLSGKVVLASYSGYPSMINEASSGFFIPAGDVDAMIEKIKMLYVMPPFERLAMGLKGKEWLIQNRTYKVISQKFVNDFLKDPDEILTQ